MNDDNISAQTSFVFRPANASSSARRNGKTRDTDIPAGRTPRASKMMALAIHLQSLVDNGDVNDYATLAKLAHVSRARVTQIMDLTMLAPDVQEDLLFLPKIEKGRDTISERMLRSIMAEPVWAKQRELWSGLRQRQ
ncbi:hypothetical protein [uncultured Desulfovibrio sp.]|uniref:hypothetical protein n=1 Tax=uncultured Desulfovibrio sp. TaxID=167968 RepID=UPI0026079CAD|nr:hypothetical protein [uncultured Desulfovibrio sp.]